MFYKFKGNNKFITEYYKQLSDKAYIDKNGIVFNKEEIDSKTSDGEFTEVTETEFLIAVMEVIKTKRSLISDYESDIKNLQFLFHVGYLK